ncbi:MAG: hypothetical protein J6W29_03325 [Neisseriaceae bacterium]|nr:hypothetical protein [Neisseriaceae bacterium]
MNGYSVELAEAQMQDYMALKKDVDSIKDSMSQVLTQQEVQKESMSQVLTQQAVQGEKIDLIINRMNSPVEQERLQGAYWRALATVMKSKVMWLILIMLVFLIAMTGNEIKHLLGWLPNNIG